MNIVKVKWYSGKWDLPDLYGIDWSQWGEAIAMPHHTISQKAYLVATGSCALLEAYAYDQLHDEAFQLIAEVQYRFYPGAVYALKFRPVRDRDVSVLPESDLAISENGRRAYSVQCYRVGCMHQDTVETLPARWAHDHWFRCTKCGYEWGYDSSG